MRYCQVSLAFAAAAAVGAAVLGILGCLAAAADFLAALAVADFAGIVEQIAVEGSAVAGSAGMVAAAVG